MNKNYCKHGMRHTKLYRVWIGMKSRCYDQNHAAYYRYGGRGITVCDEWKFNFKSFHEWAMSNGYDETAERGKCTLDRIDNEKGYSPENCRWVTMKEQSNNRRTNYNITYNGETHNITEWSKILGLKKTTLEVRLLRGWSIERALTTPVKK